MVIRFSMFRYPRARALAAWISPFTLSTGPLESLDSKVREDPRQVSADRALQSLERSESRAACPRVPARQQRLGLRRVLGQAEDVAKALLQSPRPGRAGARAHQVMERGDLSSRQSRGVLQQCPARALELGLVLELLAPDLVERGVRQRHDMERIERQRRVRQMLGDTGDERLRQIRAGVGDVLRRAAGSVKLGGEALDGTLVSPFAGEDHAPRRPGRAPPSCSSARAGSPSRRSRRGAPRRDTPPRVPCRRDGAARATADHRRRRRCARSRERASAGRG